MSSVPGAREGRQKNGRSKIKERLRGGKRIGQASSLLHLISSSIDVLAML